MKGVMKYVSLGCTPIMLHKNRYMKIITSVNATKLFDTTDVCSTLMYILDLASTLKINTIKWNDYSPVLYTHRSD